MPEWVKWGLDGILGAALLAVVAEGWRRWIKKDNPPESAEHGRSATDKLQESRQQLPGNKGKTPPANCRLKVVRFLAALNAPIPYITVTVEITNFETEPLTLFVLSIGTLHINKGPVLTNIEQFTPDTIPATDHKQLTISRNLNPNEIKALSEVPDRPAADARSSVTALVNVKWRDSMPSSELNEIAGGRIEGEPPYLLYSGEEWATASALLERQTARAQEAPDHKAQALTLDEEERRVMSVYANEVDAANGVELNALAGYLGAHAVRTAVTLDSLRNKGLLKRQDAIGGVSVYVPTASGLRYLIDQRLV